jgi:hypothetical protein
MCMLRVKLASGMWGEESDPVKGRPVEADSFALTVGQDIW